MCISDTARTASRRTVPLESSRPCRRASEKKKKRNTKEKKEKDISIRKNVKKHFLPIEILFSHSTIGRDRVAVRRQETISSSVHARIVTSRRTRSSRHEIIQCSIIVLVSIFSSRHSTAAFFLARHRPTLVDGVSHFRGRGEGEVTELSTGSPVYCTSIILYNVHPDVTVNYLKE